MIGAVCARKERERATAALSGKVIPAALVRDPFINRRL